MTAYATAAQLEAYLPTATAATLNFEDDTDEIARQLQRASDLIDSTIRGAFTADDDGLPTDATIAAAFANACCAQYEFWLAAGEEHDIEGQAGRQASAGGASWTVPHRLCDRAVGYLLRVNAFAVGGVCVGASA